jgi:hypothetical protein
MGQHVVVSFVVLAVGRNVECYVFFLFYSVVGVGLVINVERLAVKTVFLHRLTVTGPRSVSQPSDSKLSREGI